MLGSPKESGPQEFLLATAEHTEKPPWTHREASAGFGEETSVRRTARAAFLHGRCIESRWGGWAAKEKTQDVETCVLVSLPVAHGMELGFLNIPCSLFL